MSAKAKSSLLRQIELEIEILEGQAAAEEAEAIAAAQAGERLDHDEEMRRCAADTVYWFNRWVWTYDPRVVGQKDEQGRARTPYMQMKLWPKQEDFVRFMVRKIDEQEPWAIKKSRDQGATYLILGVAVHKWLFAEGFKTSITSGRGADYIDKLGNQDSMFEKMRIILHRLPAWMLPDGFDFRKHDSINRLVNPKSGAVISGDVGDEAGRSGRSGLYLVDEAAYVSNPVALEAALSGNTDCIGWVSTYHPSDGPGNFYARKVASLASSQIFTLHWRDDPRKNDEWAAKKKASLVDESTWDAEYEMDPDAKASDICIPSAWVRSALDIAKLEPRLKRGSWGVTGGDIGGGGRGKSVAITRFGAVVTMDGIAWRKDGDTTDTAYWLLAQAATHGSKRLNFDAPGIGAGVASTLTHASHTDDNGKLIHESEFLRRDISPDIMRTLQVFGVNTGLPPSQGRVWPDGRRSSEMFGNMKAELAWLLRTRFQRTHWHVLWLRGEEGGAEQNVEDLISIPDDPELVAQLPICKYGRDEKGKIVIESKRALAKRNVPSPDFFDTLVLTMVEPDEPDVPDIELDLTSFSRPNPWAIGGTGKSEFSA